MTWRGATTTQERLLSCLPYILPLLNALPFGGFLFNQFPPLAWLFLPISLLAPIYYAGGGGLAIVPILVFIGLIVGVVRNNRIRHLIRYNAMQAILIGFALALVRMLLLLMDIVNAAVLSPIVGNAIPEANLFIIVLFDVLFLGSVGIVVYSVVQSLRGHHAEVPVISDAAYSQTR
ncbi:Tic20 family protein [Acaryochloris sp. IP29b_bin.148]|uniref:Tic20 family protein n=1 Tax=Acaryochloris sp. IP29b_bin.148 TaxID=2969218 RepID=UPI002622C570|nr:Tic20 family protein [Acaryochloris sp. IP29b_bin.148]